MSHRKFEHPRHGSLGFLPRKRAARHRGKGTCQLDVLIAIFQHYPVIILILYSSVFLVI